ncbi:response regulator transcription factor [Pelagicoccus mobilis]|uniref:Response regulator transcription factor n=1 Tax=Pelagicoccus mobilis TaxID=415221 RepID=A0A934RZU9_9BACT|nr:response regulator transcription factor [Pelagicoccus mobilis]MBK1877332.1 response regulator transcription factor [Pelagicoccus mobilis]
MKLLVVEDTIPLLETLCSALREEGYIVDSAANGDEGLYLIQEHNYDGVILDIMLPGQSGLDILRKARSGKDQTPILLLTARDSVTDRIAGLDLGADDYVTKPFDLQELLARVRAICRRGRGERTTVIRISDVELDTAKRQASRAGSPIDLTSREYAIIETLIQMRGQSVSRNYLYEHLYSEDDSTLSNVLDVYICRLRSKFGKDFIKTQRGYGYIVDHQEVSV